MPEVIKKAVIIDDNATFLEHVKETLICYARARILSKSDDDKAICLLQSVLKIDLQTPNAVPTLLKSFDGVDAREFTVTLPSGEKLCRKLTIDRLQTMSSAKNSLNSIDALIQKVNFLTLAVTTAVGRVNDVQPAISKQANFVLSMLSQLASFLHDAKRQQLTHVDQKVIKKMISAFQQTETKYATFFSDVSPPNKKSQLPSSHPNRATPVTHH